MKVLLTLLAILLPVSIFAADLSGVYKNSKGSSITISRPKEVWHTKCIDPKDRSINIDLYTLTPQSRMAAQQVQWGRKCAKPVHIANPKNVYLVSFASKAKKCFDLMQNVIAVESDGNLSIEPDLPEYNLPMFLMPDRDEITMDFSMASLRHFATIPACQQFTDEFRKQ